jgi:F-type H+-transporting ATPase subunit b
MICLNHRQPNLQQSLLTVPRLKIGSLYDTLQYVDDRNCGATVRSIGRTGATVLSVELVALLVGVSAAGAQSPTTEFPVNPPVSESSVSWQQTVVALIAFVAIAYFSVRIVRRSLATARRNRTERIAGQQAAADQSQADGSSAKERYEAELLDASAEVGRIIEAGRYHAAQVSAEVTQQGRERLEEVRARVNAEAEVLRAEAVADVRDEAAKIAAELAQQLVRADLDAVATQRLIDTYMDRRANDSP